MEDRVTPLDDSTPGDLAAVEALLARAPWPVDDDALDEETLAAWAEGGLGAAERDAVEARLATWPEGRAWMTAVREAGGIDAPPAGAPAAGSAPRAPWLPLAAAALLLLAFGTAFWLGAFDAPSPGTLTETVAKLRTDHADLFRDFNLLTEEQLAGRREAERGGLVALRPHHAVLTTRPTLAWTQRDGMEQVEVALYDGQGRVIWKRTATGNTLPYPDVAALAPGRPYLWEVSGDAGLGHQTARRHFEVAAPERAARFQRAVAVIKDVAVGERAAVVAAHHAIRQGLLLEAERLLAPWKDREDASPLVAKTLAYVAGQ